MSYLGLSGGQYRPLTEKQIQAIHEASLQILEKTGMSFEPGLKETVKLLTDNGARLDTDSSRLFFPGEMIEELAGRAPEQVVLYSRDGKNDLDLGQDRVHIGTGGAAVKILDLDSGDVRSSTLKDLYALGRLVDKLKNIHFFLRPCIPTDIPESAYDLNVFYTCLKATGKHVMAGVNDEQGLKNVLDMVCMLAGDQAELSRRPFISIITSFAISPLKLCTQSTRIMQEAVRRGIPVALSSAPMAGSTAPYTMAGLLAQLHAEELAGIAICQLTKPGAPVLYGGIPGLADLRTMGYCGGAIECGMLNAAVHQLAQHVGLPNYNSSGLTDSKLPDTQAGWEKAMTTLLGAMGGSNYMHHAAGMLESMIAVAYEQYIIDDEIIGMSGKVLKGIEVDAEHLALDVIDQVGPGGEYMTAEHTLKHMYDEFFQGNGITDRMSRETWTEQGSRDARTRAREMARKILEKEEEPYISKDLDQAIQEKYDIYL